MQVFYLSGCDIASGSGNDSATNTSDHRVYDRDGKSQLEPDQNSPSAPYINSLLSQGAHAEAYHQAHSAARVLAVNLGESRSPIVDWVTQLGLTFDIVLDPDQSIASLYRLRGQPSTYVVAPDSIITSTFLRPYDPPIL